MKKLCYTTMIATLLLCILGCASKQRDQLTVQQIEQIKNEVKVEIDSLLVKWEMLDDVGCIKYYSTDMHRIGSESLLDFQWEKNAWENVKSLNNLKIESTYEDFIVLTENLVISAWVGKLTRVGKSRDTLQIDKQAYTNVWKKNNGQWKIIYEHGCSFD